MSSKFFTWTKGDRSRHAPESLFTGAVVPIPVECIHIKGFDYSQASKSGRRRPVPLTLEKSPEDSSSYDQQLDDSTALQDAAVKSATSLIAVVNDMLRSPLASARLPPQPSSLAPNHGRPRSRTAPSTPLVEAPARPPLVELPGSIPDRPRASYHQSFDGKLKTRMSKGPRHNQPCQSARRPSHPWLHLPHNFKDDTSIAETSDVATHHSPHQLQQHPQWENSSEELARARASLPSASTDQTRQSFVPGTVASRQSVTSRESDSRFPRSSLNLMRKEDQPLIENQVESSEDDRMPLYDIASLHASHEDHTATIVEAHRREVASLRMYITFLEQRRGLSRTNNDHIHPPVGSRSEARDSESNAGLAMTLPGHLSAAGAPYSRHEHLNPSLDTHCTSYAGYGEIWLECNHLRNRLETCRRQIAHAEETISRMQRLELSLKSENGNLRSRLLAANNERMDVQEGLYEAYKDLRNLAEREAGLIQENEELRRRNIHVTRSTVLPENANSPATRRKAGHCRTMSDVSYQHTQSGPSLAQVATRITILPEHAQKQQTETELSERRQQAQVGDGRRQSNPHGSQMSELTSLSARSVPRQNIDATVSTRNGNTNIPCTSESCRNENLSYENHCAQTDGVQLNGHGLQGTTMAEFDSSTAQNQHGTYPTTPKNRATPKRCLPTARTPSPSPSLSSSKSSSTSPSALGISLPQTPRTIASTAVEAHPMPTTELQSFAYPKTPPAGMNKRLPKTPPLDSDPLLLPVAAHSPVIKRGETMKSVGGSIIELYAGRGRGDGSEWARGGLGEDGGWVDWV